MIERSLPPLPPLDEELAGTYGAIITVGEASCLFGLLSCRHGLGNREGAGLGARGRRSVGRLSRSSSCWFRLPAGSGSRAALTIFRLDVELSATQRALKEAQAQLRALAGSQAAFADVAATKPLLKVDELALRISDLQQLLSEAKRSAPTKPPTDKKDSDVDKEVELAKARAAKHTKALPFRIRPENFKELSKERFESLTKRLIELELVVQDDSQRWTWKH
ncbi:hypothetical protein OC834_005372 [Tilletia horrida]|nr:hypothetical protein OC834_005372 [Tilletia horrida]